MKLTKSKLKQLIKEELENILYEQSGLGGLPLSPDTRRANLHNEYRLIIPKVFCIMGQCQQPGMRVIKLETGVVVAAAKGRAKTEEEANKIAHAALAKKLAAKGLDIKKIKVLKKK